MSYADWFLNSWWLLPSLWAALSLLASAALGTLQDEATADDAGAGEQEEPRPDAAQREPYAFPFDTPDRLWEVIGRYDGALIYRSAVFGGVEYEYDRIYTPGLPSRPDERIIVPGLVYVRRFR